MGARGHRRESEAQTGSRGHIRSAKADILCADNRCLILLLAVAVTHCALQSYSKQILAVITGTWADRVRLSISCGQLYTPSARG